MQIDLSGKTALVTGSTGGIGLAIAKGLAAAGAAVVVNGRKGAGTDAAVEAVQKAGPAEVRGVVADVGTVAGCDALVAAAPEIDILVNNAGIFKPTDFFQIPDKQWTEMLEVNVLAGMRLCRALLPGMERRGWGRVIFLSSESGLNIPADMIDYGVTKTADLALSRGLAKRMAGTGVTVNSVLPGPTLSEGVEAMLEDERAKTGKPIEEVAAAFVQAHRASSIIRRAATVEEVANMGVYLASPLASATTGAAMRVDGGVIDTL